MGIDRTTKIDFMNIVIDDNKIYLDELRHQAEKDGQNSSELIKERGCKVLSLTMDDHSFNTEEIYFDENGNNIYISGEMTSSNGKSSIYLVIPLSDIVLIDILEYALKKLNKLKTAMETLK